MRVAREKEERLGRNGIGIVRGVDVGMFVMRSVPFPLLSICAFKDEKRY